MPRTATEIFAPHRGYILWLLSTAQHRVYRRILLREVPQEAYDQLLAAGEIREFRDRKRVFVCLTMKGMKWNV
jgi:hypothetical protein